MFDAHCDTLLKLNDDNNLHSNKFDVDFLRLSSYGKAAQLFAVFNDDTLLMEDVLNLIDRLKIETYKSNLAKFCVDYNDIVDNTTNVSVLVSIEALGNAHDFSICHMRKLYDAGVRILGFTWNNDNVLCGGIGENRKGLSAFGKVVAQKMAELKMSLDVSHISDCGFWDVSEIQDLNILATHSNSRKICKHSRNLTDEQFLCIRDKGGVVGLNTHPIFINGCEIAGVCDLISHIEHFASLGGIDNICLGADFDGIDFHMYDVNSCDKMYILFNQLKKMNYTDYQINGLCYENLLRFYKNFVFE